MDESDKVDTEMVESDGMRGSGGLVFFKWGAFPVEKPGEESDALLNKFGEDEDDSVMDRVEFVLVTSSDWWL